MKWQLHVIDTSKAFIESLYPGFWVIWARAKTNYKVHCDFWLKLTDFYGPFRERLFNQKNAQLTLQERAGLYINTDDTLAGWVVCDDYLKEFNPKPIQFSVELMGTFPKSIVGSQDFTFIGIKLTLSMYHHQRLSMVGWYALELMGSLEATSKLNCILFFLRSGLPWINWRQQIAMIFNKLQWPIKKTRQIIWDALHNYGRIGWSWSLGTWKGPIHDLEWHS